MPHNFKNTPFSGTLLELLETCWEYMPDANTQINAHKWLLDQPTIFNNLLPIRKFAPFHSKRGQIEMIGQISFVPVDNEPLAALYCLWKDGKIPSHSIGHLFQTTVIPVSWKCDAESRNDLRFSGVSTPFRDHGLKLAHIFDAAAGIQLPITIDSIKLRFLRSLSPLNVFLFPSYKQVAFHLLTTNTNWIPQKIDWAEDDWIRQIALGWLINKIGANNNQLFIDEWKKTFGIGPIPNPNWRSEADNTNITVTPIKNAKANIGIIGMVPTRIIRLKPSSLKINENKNQNNIHECPKIPKRQALSVEDSIEMLRYWRLNHPTATQLNGKIGNDPSPWVHFKVEGYSTPADDFQSRHGDKFIGTVYNGIVNFHGDTSAAKIDEFILLIDSADDYHDVLRPSATYEDSNRNPPANRKIKPKFALQGYRQSVEGFYLYHD